LDQPCFTIQLPDFQIPSAYQHKVLFWGIIGALIMRVIFIFAGVALIEKFHWTIYIFGIFLIYTGYKMFSEKDKKMEPEKNPVIRFFRKVMPVSNHLEGDKFFITENGKRHATPLFLVLILIETTDLIFAVDSIPAILAITQDRFIVYTSNVFAILGLRSLYFALAHVIHRFVYLSTGLAVILIFVGLKIDHYRYHTYIQRSFLLNENQNRNAIAEKKRVTLSGTRIRAQATVNVGFVLSFWFVALPFWMMETGG
jgi:tellurite resistance protein TerC